MMRRVAAMAMAAAWMLGASHRSEAQSPDPSAAGSQGTLASLHELRAGALSEDVPVASLFTVPLDRVDEIAVRTSALRNEIADLEAEIAERRGVLDGHRTAAAGRPAAVAPGPENVSDVGDDVGVGVVDAADAPEPARGAAEEAPGEPAPPEAAPPAPSAQPTASLDPPGPSVDLALLKSELDALVLRRAVAGERRAYLEALRDQLRGMAEAGRRVLPRIGEPRTALREHAAAVASLAEALSGLAERLEELRVRVESGALVGFRAEARERDAELSRLGATLLDRSAQMEEVAAAHYRLADGFESEARGLRRQFFTSVLDPERVQRMDPLFLRHLEEQRRLQRSAGRGQGSKR
jgi:hypothetical protein